MTQAKKHIAFFDLDETLTHSDTMWCFLKYLNPGLSFYFKIIPVIPFLLFFKLGWIYNIEAKQKLFQVMLHKIPMKQVHAQAKKFSLIELPKLLNPKAVEKLRWHLNENHEVVIISASWKLYIEPWATQLGLITLATEFSYNSDHFTGDYKQLNCHGTEKVRRVKERFDLSQYDEIYAYGDSAADRHLLALATHSFFRKFY